VAHSSKELNFGMRAKCIEAMLEDAVYAECFIDHKKYVESIAVYLMSGEWLARRQRCDYYADCGLK